MLDEHDRRLVDLVHPPDHRNPSPASSYDLVVIGGGTAGLVCAAGAAGLGARVALVERARLGGDCLNTGCVPSKALLRSARVVGEARSGAGVGVPAQAKPDFAAVMARLRARRADLAPHDSVDRLTSLGVDVFFGTGRFTGPRSVAVTRDEGEAGSVLHFRSAVIATGSRPAVPSIPGLTGTPILTSESVFELQEQPRELVVLGAGPSGCELAQALRRLGTRVTLVEAASQVLPREDPDAASLVLAALREDGVDVLVGTRIASARWEGGRFTLTHEGGAVSSDAVLVTAGRVPCTDGLGLDTAGVAAGGDGIVVDDRLRTSNRRIYAAGDVCSRLQFTHAADAMARIVIQNALFFGRRRLSRLVIPRCTFTTPEVAGVGLAADEAARAGAAAITIPLTQVDRSVLDETTSGFLRLYHARGRIVGATVVGPSAGELVGTITMAMQHGHKLADLASVVFPYPTVSLALRQAADAYRRSALTPPVRRLLAYYFGARR
jgi:pyruvate/2-oxoglutarate dehydrogenase complex dihydrolipoamide dehydrogenase (E3) component